MQDFPRTSTDGTDKTARASCAAACSFTHDLPALRTAPALFAIAADGHPDAGDGVESADSAPYFAELVTLARGNMNSCLVEFPDGYRMVTSRNAIGKAAGSVSGREAEGPAGMTL
jgi:hypothetical protein